MLPKMSNSSSGTLAAALVGQILLSRPTEEVSKLLTRCLASSPALSVLNGASFRIQKSRDHERAALIYVTQSVG